MTRCVGFAIADFPLQPSLRKCAFKAMLDGIGELSYGQDGGFLSLLGFGHWVSILNTEFKKKRVEFQENLVYDQSLKKRCDNGKF